MATTNKTLNFYIYQMQEDSYNLYNALTDKEIYFDVDTDTVKSFLSLNEPTHPFILSAEDNHTFEFTFDTTLTVPTDADALPASESQWDTSMYTDSKIEYSLYDPFHSPDDSNYQMNFTFINNDDERSEIDRDEEVFEEELEFLPEDK